MKEAPEIIGSSRALREERRRELLACISSEGQLTVRDIVRRFGVSQVTARGDLDALCELGLVERSHGGAVRSFDPRRDYSIQVKAALNRPEKVRIARAAVNLIQKNQTVILDSGTTTAEIARNIAQLEYHSVRVITNALNIAEVLADAPNVSLIMVGGLFLGPSRSFVGPHAEQMMKTLHADHLFLGADAIDANSGPSTPDVLAAQLNGAMIRACDQVTIVADASKLGRRSVCSICSFSEVRRIITDTRIDPSIANLLKNQGVELIIA